MNQFKGDVADILIHMEEIYDIMLSEGASRQDFCEDMLKALDSVQHDQPQHTMLKLKHKNDEGTIVTPSVIISKVTTKFNSLEGHKGLPHANSSKCLSFMTSEKTLSG